MPAWPRRSPSALSGNASTIAVRPAFCRWTARAASIESSPPYPGTRITGPGLSSGGREGGGGVALGESGAGADVTGAGAGELAGGLAITVGCDARTDESWLAAAWCEVEQAPSNKVTATAAGTYTRCRGRKEDTLHLRASPPSCSPNRPRAPPRLESVGW